MNILKKSLLTLFAFLVLSTGSLTLFAKSAQAQWYRQTYPQWVAIVDSGDETELYGERYTAAQVRWIIYGMVYAIFGDHPAINCAIIALSGPLQGAELKDVYQGCFATFFSNLIFSSTNDSTIAQASNNVFTPPLSSATYFKTIGQRLHIVPEAQAQGFGFEAADVVFKIWEGARNTSYALLIIVVVIMAFMIMFRVKLSPQTVISVQSALPKVIVTLILITFSYAIAGLMIDLMYVSIGLLTTILMSSGLVTVAQAGSAGGIDWGELFGELTYANGAFELMGKYFIMFIGAFLWALFSNVAGVTLGVIAIITGPVGAGAGGVMLILIFLIVAIMLLILAFRVAWMLIKNFVMIILSIAFSPFQILFGALGSGGFGPWAKNLAGLLAVYPVTGFMFVLSFIFLRGASLSVLPSDIWPFDVAEVVNNSTWSPPLTGGTNDLDLIWLGVSLAIIALIPKVSEMIKGFMSGRPLAYGTAIGEGFAFASGAVTGAAGMAGTAVKQAGVGAILPHAQGWMTKLIPSPTTTNAKSSKVDPSKIKP